MHFLIEELAVADSTLTEVHYTPLSIYLLTNYSIHPLNQLLWHQFVSIAQKHDSGFFPDFLLGNLVCVCSRRYNYTMCQNYSVSESRIPARTAKVCKYLPQLHIVDVGGKLHSQRFFFTLLLLQTFSTLINIMFWSLIFGSFSSLCSCWFGSAAVG